VGAAGTGVKIGVMAPYADALIANGSFLHDYAATLDEIGVESVWAVEHVVVADQYEPNYPYSADGRMPSRGAIVPMPDPLELLAFLAACSTRLVLGTAVVVAPLHSPVVLAKRAATLDRLSGGRFRLGLGIGWQREEYAAVGASFRDRGLRLEESVAAMRALWQDGPSTYHGTTVSFDAVHLDPKPGGGRIPVVLGGNSDAAVRRAGRIADGWFPYTLSPEEVAGQVEVLRAGADEAGRDLADIEITAWPGSCDPTREHDPAWVRGYVDAGATRLLVRSTISRPDQLAGMGDALARYRDDVVGAL
jgi:probable F420-dependent oxidoreductase